MADVKSIETSVPNQTVTVVTEDGVKLDEVSRSDPEVREDGQGWKN